MLSQNVVAFLMLFLLFCRQILSAEKLSVGFQHSLQVFRQWANDGVYKSVQSVQNAVLYLQLLSPSFNLKDTLPVLNCETTRTSVFNPKVLLWSKSLLQWKKYGISTVELKSKKMWRKLRLNRKCFGRFKEVKSELTWNTLDSDFTCRHTVKLCGLNWIYVLLSVSD